VMSEMGKAMMGTGEAEGDRRAVDAAEAAINNPLLEDVSMKGARGVLINITGGTDMTLFEVDEAANRIREEVDPDANIIFGSTFDEKLAGKMRISVVATGIDAELAPDQARSAPGARAADGEPALRDSGSAYTQPILTQNAASPPAAGDTRAEARAPGPAEPVPPAAEAAESAAVRGGAFIAPRPVDPGPARPVPVVLPAGAQSAGNPPGGAPPAATNVGPAASGDALLRPKGRVPSLIERVTGVGRARPPAPAPAPRPAAAVPARPAQQRLAPLEPEDRPGAAKEDDLLDIPAFLRRQAN